LGQVEGDCFGQKAEIPLNLFPDSSRGPAAARASALATGAKSSGLIGPKSREGFRSRAEQFVGRLSEFTDGSRQIVKIGNTEVGIFRHEGEFFAYSNYCLHQGGPACEGLTIAKVEELLREDKTSMGLFFSEKDMNFVCPWHGYEYDMKTGECISDRKLKLKRFDVVQKGEDVYVVA
jgi:nitrite reductase/ring-hydroxylating ferredoxin subunit